MILFKCKKYVALYKEYKFMKKKPMKHLSRIILFSIVFCVMVFNKNEAHATVKLMSDGTVFDAEFYGKAYPEVARIYGNSEADLYRHYNQFGKGEGRMPFDPALLTGAASMPQSGNVTTPQATTLQPAVKSTDKCIIVIGDSRTVSIICTLYGVSPDKCYSFTEERAKSITNAVFKYDNTWYVMSGQGGGCLSKNSYDNALARTKSIIEGMPSLAGCSSYSVVNLFAINDVYYDKNGYSKYPGMYLSKDAKLLTDYKYCNKVYQFNAGPVDPNGKASKKGVTNELINKYNSGFVSNGLVTCVDLNAYLVNSGYTAIVDKTDNSGLHYDPVTNVKIFNLIQATVK